MSNIMSSIIFNLSFSYIFTHVALASFIILTQLPHYYIINSQYYTMLQYYIAQKKKTERDRERRSLVFFSCPVGGNSTESDIYYSYPYLLLRSSSFVFHLTIHFHCSAFIPGYPSFLINYLLFDKILDFFLTTIIFYPLLQIQSLYPY